MTRVDHLPAIKLRKGRIAPRLKQAVEMIVHNGVSIATAAKATGYNVNSLSTALRKSHVQEFKRDIIAAFMENATELARYTLVDVARNSKSDDCRVKAARTLLEIAGELGGNRDDAPRFGDVVINVLGRPSRPGNAAQQIGDLTEDDTETVTIQMRKRPSFKSDGLNGPVLDLEHTQVDP
jgi:lambda repressor-like predicted transcriptional regulator